MLKEGLRMFEESIYWHVAILPGPFFFGPSGRRRRGGRHGRRRRRKATGTQHVWIPMKWDDHNHIPCLDPSTYVDIWWYLRVCIYIYIYMFAFLHLHHFRRTRSQERPASEKEESDAESASAEESEEAGSEDASKSEDEKDASDKSDKDSDFWDISCCWYLRFSLRMTVLPSFFLGPNLTAGEPGRGTENCPHRSVRRWSGSAGWKMLEDPPTMAGWLTFGQPGVGGQAIGKELEFLSPKKQSEDFLTIFHDFTLLPLHSYAWFVPCSNLRGGRLPPGIPFPWHWCQAAQSAVANAEMKLLTAELEASKWWLEPLQLGCWRCGLGIRYGNVKHLVMVADGSWKIVRQLWWVAGEADEAVSKQAGEPWWSPWNPWICAESVGSGGGCRSASQDRFGRTAQALFTAICHGCNGCLPGVRFPEKNGKTGKLGQDRLEVRWEAVMFLFNLVIWNVWLFLLDYLAKCFVEVVVIMFGLNEGRFCWGCYDFMFLFNVSSSPLIFSCGDWGTFWPVTFTDIVIGWGWWLLLLLEFSHSVLHGSLLRRFAPS